MSTHAELEQSAAPSEEAASTSHLHVVVERRSHRESAKEELARADRFIAAGFLAGAVAIYVVLGILIYAAVTALA